jgi:hypothetical protein
VATSVHEEVEATRRGPARSAQPNYIVDLTQFEARARQIALLRRLHAGLLEITAVVARYGSAADALHQDETRAVQDYIASADSLRRSGSRTPPRTAGDRGVPWKDKALTARVMRRGAPESPRLPSPSPGPSPPTTRLTRRTIALTDQISLDAVVIPDEVCDPREILAAVSTPELYYIVRWNHFAVRAGAVVFHGNVGRVYPAGRPQRTPARVKECRRGGACPSFFGGPPCSYYHDPAEADGRAADVRNFTADSWLYTPATSRHSARYGSRRIGTRDALESDLREISAGDARRHLAQTAHDIVCSMILAKYVLGV